MYAISTPIIWHEETRIDAAQLLDRVLADEFVLSTVTRDFHWTVTGPQFRSLHELFGEQYHQLDQWLEKIVDRARALSLSVRTGWKALTETSRNIPIGGATLSPRNMMLALIALHEAVAERLRANLKSSLHDDQPAAFHELLNDLLEYHEITGWLLAELLEDRELAQA